MEEETIKRVMCIYAYIIVALICCLVLTVLFGCSAQKPVVTERVVLKTDTVYKTKAQTDTFRILDSVYVETFTHGDTVYKTKTAWRWRDRISLRTDTLYKATLRTDTIRMPTPVEHKATWWESTQMWVGKTTLFALAVAVVSLLLWLIHRKE